MTGYIATARYWLNWRVLLCAVWLLISLVFALIVIPKYERRGKSKHGSNGTEQLPPGILYEDDVWRPCVKTVHPGWLLAYRVSAFALLLYILATDFAANGPFIMYLYTQWTFTLLTVFFGLGVGLSIYGCFQYHSRVGDERIKNGVDAGYHAHGTSTHSEVTDVSNTVKSLSSNVECPDQIAGFWGYTFQVLFQISAGAVMLTDIVYWFILVPTAPPKFMHMDFMAVSPHSINAAVLLGETAFNNLRFPWFRIAYFFLWTTIYVGFQWFVQIHYRKGWPYPFLDLSSPIAYVWYMLVALMHIPCYGFFLLVTKLKWFLLSKLQTQQCPR